MAKERSGQVKSKSQFGNHLILSTPALPGVRVCLECGHALQKGERNGPCPGKAARGRPRKKGAK